MRNHRSDLRVVSLLLALGIALVTIPGCGAPEAPEGFQIVIQLQSVSVEAVDQLRLTIAPDESMATADFEDIERMVDEDGVSIDVDGGVFVITAPGDFVREHADVTDPNNPRITFEVWTEDEAMRRGPQVSATVTRDMEVIANGIMYLTGWPVPLGGTFTLNVPCRMDSVARCLP